MGILKKIFGGSTKEVLSGIGNVADELHYSKEEKVASYLSIMSMYTAYKIAQRYLALIFCIPYALVWLLTGMLQLAVVAFGLVRDLTPITNFLLSGDMGNIVLIIIGFYFFGGAAEGTVHAIKKIRKQGD